MTRPRDTITPGPAKTSEGKAAQVERLIAPSLAAMGYDIVRVLLSGNRRARLQVMAERRDGAGMGLDDCVAVSRAVEAILEVEDPIAGSYELEVSSPGIDRPLTRLADFARFAGFEAKVETAVPIAGRRRWRGRLLGVNGDRVRLAAGEEEVTLPFSDIAKAKLVLTDELITGARAGRNV
ncbi:MAG: ribosome maturation factor RimP [Kiloniellaceae bacterium]